IDAEPAGAARMSSTTPAASDDRISPYLKAAIYIVMFILLVSGIGLIAFWMATFAKVPEKIFPDITGKKIEDARRIADEANVRLLVHEEFRENVAPGVVYQEI